MSHAEIHELTQTSLGVSNSPQTCFLERNSWSERRAAVARLKTLSSLSLFVATLKSKFFFLLSFSKMMKRVLCRSLVLKRGLNVAERWPSVTSNFKTMLICWCTLMWLHRGGRSISLVWNRSGSPQLLLDPFCAFLVFCKTNFTLKVVILFVLNISEALRRWLACGSSVTTLLT